LTVFKALYSSELYKRCYNTNGTCSRPSVSRVRILSKQRTYAIFRNE